MIIGAAPIADGKLFQEFDPAEYCIICADAGYETALRYGIKPDLIVGDFDSATQKPPPEYRNLVLPVQKDVTDTMFAVIKGFSKGLRDFLLLGCLGGERFDHTMANLEVLQYIAEHGGHGVLADETTKVLLLKDHRLRLRDMKGITVSVFPYCGSSCTVSYDGLEYPLNKRTLNCGGTLMGVSNSVVSQEASIRVHGGTALIVLFDASRTKSS